MIVYPNAKLNLGLRVSGRREDGFHDIETLFIPYTGMQDLLEITPDYNDGVTLVADNLQWPAEKDLTVAAYNLLRQDFDMPGVRIRLNKHIPVGAGLGGGSADAAFTLKALNKLFDLGMDEQRMAAYAARLGSDCPFFIYNRPMLGTGRGEALEPFDIDLSAYRIKVVVPEDISVNTAQAYRELDNARKPDSGKAQGRDTAMPEDKTREGKLEAARGIADILCRPVEEWRGLLANDFESVIFPEHPELAKLKESLYEAGAAYASMSGSGSAVFALSRRQDKPAWH